MLTPLSHSYIIVSSILRLCERNHFKRYDRTLRIFLFFVISFSFLFLCDRTVILCNKDESYNISNKSLTQNNNYQKQKLYKVMKNKKITMDGHAACDFFHATLGW